MWIQLPDLANKTTGHTVYFEFQIKNEYLNTILA